MRTITTTLLLGTAVLAMSLAGEPANGGFREKGEALLRQCEPDLSLYTRRIRFVAAHGWHRNVSVEYQLKPDVKANSASLRLYILRAFQSANWTNQLPFGVSARMRSSSGQVIMPMEFRKEPFQLIPGYFAPESVTALFLKDGLELGCLYSFRYTKEAEPMADGGDLKPAP